MTTPMTTKYGDMGLGSTVLSKDTNSLTRYYTDPYRARDLSTFSVSQYNTVPAPVDVKLDTKMPETTETPASNWVRDTSTLGTLGLGLAGFLEDRKTAKLQREALRNDIATAREHRANRKALGESWNKAWSS